MMYGFYALVSGVVELITIDKPFTFQGASGVSSSIMINKLGFKDKVTCKILPEAKEKLLTLSVGDSVECDSCIDLARNSVQVYNITVVAKAQKSADQKLTK